jgi:hypothetical protein
LPRTAGIDVRQVRRTRKEKTMGVNPWNDLEERKRNERDAKAGEDIPEDKGGDASSRLETSEESVEDPEKRRVVEKLKKREQDS